jgi:glyoxylase-like metal-dependent hydrolase (beta-lactamase superfamily II)
VTAIAPFETYPFSLDVRIDQPAGRMHVRSRSAIAGGFQFTDVQGLQSGKGFGLTPELNTYREVSGEPGFVNRYLPHRIVRQALQNRASVRSHDGRVSFATSNGQLLSLTFDPDTSLLRRIEQVGSQGIWGDGMRETLYDDYRRTGTLMLPRRVRVRGTNGVHGAVESSYRVEASDEVTIDPKELELPAGYVKADRSYRPSFAAREIAPNVHLLENVTSTSGQWSYNVLAVVFDDFVLVAEAPASSATSEQVLAKIREIAPGKPVKYLVQSHHHDDHIAGIRPYIADETTILAGPSAKPLIEKIAAAPFHLDPDRLHRRPADAIVETVSTSRTIRDADHAAVIYNIGPNPHARDLLIVYLPKEKILWQADMINDGEYPENASTRDFEKKISSLGLDYQTIVGLHGRQRSATSLVRE